MGRQRNYYMTPKDIEECYQRIQKCGEVCIIKAMTYDPNAQILSSISVLEMGKEWLSVYLIRPQDISKITYKYIETQGYYLLDEREAPVIDFGRCYFKDGILRRARFYYRPSYYNEKDELIGQPEDFIKWAQCVLRAGIKGLFYDGSFYIGDEAKQVSDEGKCQLSIR